TLEGFAEISAKKLIDSINRHKKATLARLINGLSISQVGEETAILLAQNFKTIATLAAASEEKLSEINGIGPVVAKSIYDWFNDKQNKKLIERLLKHLTVQNPDYALRQAQGEKLKLFGKTFVLTGGLSGMSRDEAKQKIRALGG